MGWAGGIIHPARLFHKVAAFAADRKTCRTQENHDLASLQFPAGTGAICSAAPTKKVFILENKEVNKISNEKQSDTGLLG